MKITLITFGLFVLPMALFANHSNSTAARIDYIEQYAEFARMEMLRSKVPASITLAQGIIESNAGQSDLSRGSLNHFGIKCKKNWKGNTFYHKDDDYENGKLIKSCFRAYDSVLESFADHSNFLMDNPRYARLFDLHPTDYRGWAYGLKDCGYATNPKYAEMLIKIIEEFSLFVYDLPVQPLVKDHPVKIQPPVEEEGMPAIILEVPTYRVPEEMKPKKEKRKRFFKRKTAAMKVRPVRRTIRPSVSTR